MFTRTRKLPWPMSRIGRDLLHELWQKSQDRKMKITEVVSEAVVAHLNQRLEASAHAAEPMGSCAPAVPSAAA